MSTHMTKRRGSGCPSLMTQPDRRNFMFVALLEGKCVLLVDDDDSQREVVSEILQLEGVKVLSARTAAEASRLLAEQPDIALLDLHGVATGEFMDVLRQTEPRPVLILLSGDVKLSEHAQRLGADGYLAKPYELDELLDALRAALDSRDAGREANAPHP